MPQSRDSIICISYVYAAFFSFIFQVNFAFSQESLTEDEFFGENIVNNLAAFLGIPQSKIRVMEIVSASTTTTTRRRRRSTDELTKITVSEGTKAQSHTVFEKKSSTLARE